METLLLALQAWLALPGADAGTSSISVFAIWSVMAILWGLHHRVRDLAQWSWEHYQLAQGTLEDTYAQRSRYEQALTDLTHANRQLALMNEKLAAARQVAEEAQKTKAAFVANVSHEFRTPLNMIIGLTDLLLETPEVYGQQLPPALMEDLEIVCRNCQHLSAMINDVLDLSQIEAGQLAMYRERVALYDEIEKALNIVRPLIDRKGLALEVTAPLPLPDVYCDRTRIRQVILNLLSNAARLTERGSIRVRIQLEDPYVVVSVSDTGPGIAPEEAQKIFQPFFRGTKSPPNNHTGSGLGLSISRQFVELHDGKMWLESTVNVGSTFYFRLPVSPFDVPAARAGARNVEDWVWYERSAASALPKQPLRQRILVCDASGDLRAFCARHWDEVEVVDCRDLDQVVEQARCCPAQAILLNDISPSLLYSRLEQARLLVPDLPIIGCSLPVKTERAVAMGASSYLLKPALRADLQGAIEKVGKPVRHVLIVDDNADAQKVYARMLRSFDEGLEVTTAASGAAALDRLGTEHPDLVLLDIVLPDMDGWQVLAAKSQREDLKDIPVIIISAQDPSEQPLNSPLLVATMGNGLALHTLMRGSRSLLTLLLQPD